MASGFIVSDSCPSDNPSIPVHAFPALTISNQSTIAPGQKIVLQFQRPDPSDTLYAAFLIGLDALIVPLGSDNSATIPEDIRGTAYVLVTSNATGVDDSVTVAGPTMIQLAFDSNDQPEQF
jgi:hypothetical protein